jgi:CBS domain containing-hemolysin-like protein
LLNIASAANMTSILLMLFGENAGWINILVMVPLLLLVAEVTPKTIAVNFPLGFSKKVSSRVLPRWIYAVTPLREAVRLVADGVTTWLVGEVVDRENLLQPDELKTLLEEGEETGIIDATERVLIDNLLEASETDISHIMTPGPRIRFLDATEPLPQIIQSFREYEHPRVPVYSGHWDNVIGFVHSEDVLRLVRGGVDLEAIKIEDILRPAHFVPPTIMVAEMFNFFQEHRTRAAIVLGEFGEVLGIVTMKDVLTFFFGEITGKMRGSDDYRQDESGYLVPGDMRLLDFYNLTNIDIDDPVMTTVGGLVFRLFGRLPTAGETVAYEGYNFTVMEVNGLRISRLRVGASDAAKPPEAPESRQEPPVEPEPELEPELERVVGQGESKPARSLESDNRAKEATGGQ